MGRRTTKEDFPSSCFSCHLDNFIRRSTTNNRIIYKQNILARKFVFDRIKFESNGLFPRSLSRHNESSSYVPIFDVSFTEWSVQKMRSLKGTCSSGFWDGNNHINTVVGI